MRETTWMETSSNTAISDSDNSSLSLYEGNYLNGNKENEKLKAGIEYLTLPLWGKLLEWKRRERLPINLMKKDNSPFMRETTWMETHHTYPKNSLRLYSPFMRETTWMETFNYLFFFCILF